MSEIPDYIPGFVPSAADKHYDGRLRSLYSLKNKLEAENAVMHGALVDIAHTETEDSHGGSKDMPSGYYRAAARTALGLLAGDHPKDLLNAYRMRVALEHISGLRGYQGEDMGRVSGYRLAADIAEDALKADKSAGVTKIDISDLSDEEITRAYNVLKNETDALAKAGVVGPNNGDKLMVAQWVIAALLRRTAPSSVSAEKGE